MGARWEPSIVYIMESEEILAHKLVSRDNKRNNLPSAKRTIYTSAASRFEGPAALRLQSINNGYFSDHSLMDEVAMHNRIHDSVIDLAVQCTCVDPIRVRRIRMC